MAAVRARSAATRLLMLQLHSVSNGPSGSLPRRLRSLLLLFPMFQLRSASNGPSISYNIYIYRVYVDSHSLGQLALASKRIS